MPKDMLKDFNASQEAKKEHVIEVHYQDLKKKKYEKERFTGSKLEDVVDEAFELVNEVASDEEKEFKFVGFPSDK
tara:strand:- start:2867 stop:3091 length:225 start_codon:yes stop_codon:yes gene_type:complete